MGTAYLNKEGKYSITFHLWCRLTWLAGLTFACACRSCRCAPASLSPWSPPPSPRWSWVKGGISSRRSQPSCRDDGDRGGGGRDTRYHLRGSCCRHENHGWPFCVRCTGLLCKKKKSTVKIADFLECFRLIFYSSFYLCFFFWKAPDFLYHRETVGRELDRFLIPSFPKKSFLPHPSYFSVFLPPSRYAPLRRRSPRLRSPSAPPPVIGRPRHLPRVRRTGRGRAARGVAAATDAPEFSRRKNND